MKNFSALFQELDSTTSTKEKLNALINYFKHTSKDDALVALALFNGWRPPKVINATQLRQLAAETAGIPLWLLDESYHLTGDLAETISLVFSESKCQNENVSITLRELVRKICQINNCGFEDKTAFIQETWSSFSRSERFIFNKLLSGGFRIGVASKMVIEAFSKAYDLEPVNVTQKISGDWNPLNEKWTEFIEPSNSFTIKPFPFCLAYPIENGEMPSGSPSDYLIEYKWDGIRGQIACSRNQVLVWSRGGESLNDAFPELRKTAEKLPPDTVLDGEILVIRNGKVALFSELQKRIGRKKPTTKLLSNYPACFKAFDLLQLEGEDLRSHSLYERRRLLESLGLDQNDFICINDKLLAATWEDVAHLRREASKFGAEGIMLKYLEAPYYSGRKRGVWWKWKVDPFTIDAVLIYAQAGHGRRAGLYTDFTFALWHKGQLVPFAKAYSGLTDKEMGELNKFIQQNTIQKFGPVRSVLPELVFELAFEGIQASNRHKSGVAVRFPRILRPRPDKKAQDADTLEQLLQLISI